MDVALLKAIQEGSLSLEVMAVLAAKFRQQAASDSAPPPPALPSIGASGGVSPNDHLDTIAPTVQPTIEGLGSSGSRDMPDATECKYYRIRDGIIFDMQGNQQSQKWAKRMRQKERDEKADDSSRSSSSGMADSKAMKWLQGGGEAEGAMAIAAPEAKPKSAEGEVQGAMAIAAPEPKPKASFIRSQDRLQQGKALDQQATRRQAY